MGWGNATILYSLYIHIQINMELWCGQSIIACILFSSGLRNFVDTKKNATRERVIMEKSCICYGKYTTIIDLISTVIPPSALTIQGPHFGLSSQWFWYLFFSFLLKRIETKMYNLCLINLVTINALTGF